MGLGLRGDSINKIKVLALILTGIVLPIAFNNCGAFIPDQVVSSSLGEEEVSYPWPNNTTTDVESDLMVSSVTFDDADFDTYGDAVFYSMPSDLSTASYSGVTIRVVESGDFSEVGSFKYMQDRPNPQVKPILFDVDMDESAPDAAKELIYISENNQWIVAMDLFGANAGQVRWRLAVLEPVPLGREMAFTETKLDTFAYIQIGDNIIDFKVGQSLQVVSALNQVDGGWTPFGDWSGCYKTCGAEEEVRIRSCANPIPRGGGALCQADIDGGAVQVRACTNRSCLPEDCDEYQYFAGGNCLEDPNNPRPSNLSSRGGSSSTGGGGLSGNGSDIPDGPVNRPDGSIPAGPGDCPSGTKWDNFIKACYKSYDYNDVKLTHTTYRYEDNDDGRGQRRIAVTNTHRISLSHPRSAAMSRIEVANYFCIGLNRGFSGAIGFATGTYTAGSNRFGLNVWVPCAYSNGVSWGPGRCPWGALPATFEYRGYSHPQGQQVTYLRAVYCRK